MKNAQHVCVFRSVRLSLQTKCALLMTCFAGMKCRDLWISVRPSFLQKFLFMVVTAAHHLQGYAFIAVSWDAVFTASFFFEVD